MAWICQLLVSGQDDIDNDHINRIHEYRIIPSSEIYILTNTKLLHYYILIHYYISVGVNVVFV